MNTKKFTQILYLLFFLSFSLFLNFLFPENNPTTSFEILTFSSLPSHLTRDKKGRFISKTSKIDILPKTVEDALVGELLGDGSLQYTKKDPEGKPKASANANLAITLKSFEHINFLFEKIYKDICTSRGPIPWPNPKTGKPTQQYSLKSRNLPSLSQLHKE
jgi:hypothetical protein